MKNIIITFIMTVTLVSCQNCHAQTANVKTITKNGMAISWYYENERIFLEMSAPTSGWVTVGFNTSAGMTSAYLLMGHVVNGKPNVVEHYTSSAGNYAPVATFGATPQITGISGEQNGNQTSVKFSLPTKANSKYQKDLRKGMSYTMIIAYSLEDDFQHHSVMRTSASIKL